MILDFSRISKSPIYLENGLSSDNSKIRFVHMNKKVLEHEKSRSFLQFSYQ